MDDSIKKAPETASEEIAEQKLENVSGGAHGEVEGKPVVLTDRGLEWKADTFTTAHTGIPKIDWEEQYGVYSSNPDGSLKETVE